MLWSKEKKALPTLKYQPFPGTALVLRACHSNSESVYLLRAQEILFCEGYMLLISWFRSFFLDNLQGSGVDDWGEDIAQTHTLSCFPHSLDSLFSIEKPLCEERLEDYLLGLSLQWHHSGLPQVTNILIQSRETCFLLLLLLSHRTGHSGAEKGTHLSLGEMSPLHPQRETQALDRGFAPTERC